MFKRILIPTDGSAFSERAIGHAVALARASQAGIVGITVMEPMQGPRGLVPEHLAASLATEVDKAAKANLAAIEAAAKAAGVPFEGVRETHHHPWEAIIEAARRTGADLIVMASHGRRGVAALVLGSETQKVVMHAHVPVLVVR